MRKYRPVKFPASEVNVDDQIRVNGLLYWVDSLKHNKTKDGSISSVTFHCEHATRHDMTLDFTAKADDEIKVRCVNPDYVETSKVTKPKTKATTVKKSEPSKTRTLTAVAMAKEVKARTKAA